MNRFLGALLGLMAGWLPGAMAAEMSDPVAFPQGDAAWVVALEKGGPLVEPKPRAAAPQEPAPGEGARDIKKILIVRKGDLRRDSVYWNDGTVTEYWWPAKLKTVFFQTETNGPVRSMPAAFAETRLLDATLFSWVSANTFRNNLTFRGKKCFFHETLVVVAEGEKARRFAWIEAETGKPLAWSDGINMAIFSFDAALPEAPLVMPDKFRAEFKRVETYLAAPQRSKS